MDIERLGKNMKWEKFSIGLRWEKIITIITILGIAALFLWLIFHP